MLRVLHAIDTPGPGGAETVFYDLLIGLDPDRFFSIPVLPSIGWLYDKLTYKGFQPQIVPARGAFNLKYLFALVHLIKANKIDIIHSHLFGSNVYCSLAGIITKTPVIATFHGFVDSDKDDAFLRLKFALINKGAVAIIFVSKQLRSFFIDSLGADPAKSHVIYNGVDTDSFKPGKSDTLKQELGFSPNDVIVGAIGNIRPAKGYDVLLKVAAFVKKQRKGIKFVIAGECSGMLYDELLSLRSDLQLEESVFFIGFREDTVELYHNFNIFILSSYSEGFSIATIEAMASGLPVIATKSGGPEEIINSGFSGILLDEQVPSYIGKQILKLLNSEQDMERLMFNGQRVVHEKFTIMQCCRQYSRLYTAINREGRLAG